LTEEGVLDASSAINCVNGDALDLVLSIPDLVLGVGPIVRGECVGVVERAIGSGRLKVLDEGNLPAGRFLDLLARYRLGEGETECMLFGETHGLVVVTDDRAARKAASELLGSDRVTGSLGLLRRGVASGLVSAEGAIARYQKMKAMGGFLPDICADFFST
jgi:predicted nucleic acid-binding protein